MVMVMVCNICMYTWMEGWMDVMDILVFIDGWILDVMDILVFIDGWILGCIGMYLMDVLVCVQSILGCIGMYLIGILGCIGMYLIDIYWDVLVCI